MLVKVVGFFFALGFYVLVLLYFYYSQESKKRFDEEPDFKVRALDCVVKLQSYEPDFVKAWKMICDISRKDFSQIYQRLDIKITERGESFYQKMMVDIVKDLEAKGT